MTKSLITLSVFLGFIYLNFMPLEIETLTIDQTKQNTQIIIDSVDSIGNVNGNILIKGPKLNYQLSATHGKMSNEIILFDKSNGFILAKKYICFNEFGIIDTSIAKSSEFLEFVLTDTYLTYYILIEFDKKGNREFATYCINPNINSYFRPSIQVIYSKKQLQRVTFHNLDKDSILMFDRLKNLRAIITVDLMAGNRNTTNFESKDSSEYSLLNVKLQRFEKNFEKACNDIPQQFPVRRSY